MFVQCVLLVKYNIKHKNCINMIYSHYNNITMSADFWGVRLTLAECVATSFKIKIHF